MNRLLLIDGNAIMHRAYHAMPPLTSPQGKPVQVVYGFVSMLFKLYDNLKPTHMAVAFDRPGPTFRDKLFAAYQAQRPKMEDDFISQIAEVHDMARALHIPAYETDGFEADDVIGTIANAVRHRAGWAKHADIDQVIIVTGDRDILQLVSDEKVLVYMPTKGLSEGRLYGEKEVVERMGVAPSVIPDLKALMGDSSDNYPGVAGIGPKTAIQLLSQFHDVGRLYKAVEVQAGDMKESVRSKLIAGKESAMLGKQLAVIRVDAPVTPDADAMKTRGFATPEAEEALTALRFTSLLRRVNGGQKAEVPRREQPTEKKKAQDHSHQQELF